jgi:hypothetical protein
MLQTSTTLDLLLRQFGGAHLVTIRQSGLVIGLQPQTSYNLVSRGKFPLPLVDTGSKRMVRVLDIANYIDTLADPIIIPPAASQAPAALIVATCPPKKNPGRPSKVDHDSCQASCRLNG